MSQQMPERIPGGGIDLSHLAAARTSGAPGAPAAPAAGGAAPGAQVVDVPSLILDVSDASFEQAAQLSAIVPVVVHLWSERSEASVAFTPVLSAVTRELGGRVLLATVDVDANPGVAQAFQALGAGRPVPLFQGPVREEQVRGVFPQLLQRAAQQGVVGRVNAPDLGGAAPTEPAEPVIPEAHLAAVEAAERGDYAAAVTEWEAVLTKAPADAEARAALVQVRLLQRLEGLTLEGVRADAAAQPGDLQAQLRVADLDLSGGHIEDAFLRLLERFAESHDEDRAVIRERLLELFEVVGVADPRVIAARGRLANLLY